MESDDAANLPELPDDGFGNTIDMGQDQLFLGRKMEVDRAFADADLAGHVVHGHLAVAVLGQEDIDCIKDQSADVRTLGYLSHNDL